MKVGLSTSLTLALLCLLAESWIVGAHRGRGHCAARGWPAHRVDQHRTQSRGCVLKTRTCTRVFNIAVHRARHNQQMLCSAALRYRECLRNFPCNFHANELEEKMNPVKTMLLQRAPYCSLVHPAGLEPSGPSTESDITDIEVNHFNCMYMGGRRVKLSWKLPSITTPSFLAGFKILYKLVSNSPRSRYTVRVVSVSAGVNGRFRTVLNLPRIGRYVFQVKPYSQHKEGNLCDPIYIYVSGGNLAMTPEIVINAAPVASDAVVLSSSVVGEEHLDNVNFFYTSESGGEWTQLSQDSVALEGKQSCVLYGLEGGIDYLIWAKAWLDNNYKTSLTSVLTPLNDTELTCGTSEDLPLTKGHKEDGGYYVDWSDWETEDWKGYKATVVYNAETDQERTEVTYLPCDQTRLEFEDNEDSIDSVKIEPFDAYGLKEGAEVLCVSCSET